MAERIRVLIVEDNADDAELVLRQVRLARYDPDWHRVDTEAEYIEHLHPSLDIILSDYSMPRFDGARAIELLKERGLEIPFIIVSGIIGEDIAVAAMKQGAADYLLKDRLTRLGPAVHHAMEQSRLGRERKQAVEELRLFRMLVDQSNDTFEVVDPETARFLEVNEKGCLELGYSRAEYLSLRVFDIDPLVNESAWPQVAEKIRVAGFLSREGSHRRKDGTTFPVELNAKWVRLDRDYIVAVVRDITRRKRTEEVLRESERRFREMLENVNLIAITLDKTGVVTFCNDYLLQLTGWKREEVIGADWFSKFIPEKNMAVKKMFFEMMPVGKIPPHTEHPIKTKNGELREIVWYHTMLRGADENIIGAASIGDDVTHRRRADEQLRKLSRAVEQSPVSIVITDRAGNIEYVNPKFEEVTGYTVDEVIGMNPRILKSGRLASETYAALWQTITAGREWRGEFENKKKDGELFWEYASISGIKDAGGRITNFVAVKEDITEKKKLEAQLLRSQRMDSIGALAGGVAHDLNNILAPILMCAPLLRAGLPPERLETIISTIEKSAQRGSDLVKQVLTFSRGSEGARSPVAISRLIDEMVNVSNQTFPKAIRVEASHAAGLWKVIADATQLHQVLMNLCINARDAMPDGGTLRVTAKNEEIDESYASMIPGALPGRYVVLDISDTGAGMPAEILDHIFDPFFTTKVEGKGTGLGLATVVGIVKSHDGFLSVKSQVGMGTTFKVFLPATTANLPASDAPKRADAPSGHGELILVVDDEGSVRAMAKVVLETHGYRVILASEGTEGIAVYAQNADKIALTLTDIEMPFLDGIGLIRAIKRMNPEAKIIASTGHAEEKQLAELKSLNISALLQKPHGAQTLLTTLADALSSSATYAPS